MAEGKSLPLSLLVDISDEAAFRIEEYLCVILEVDLNDLVGEAEHDRVFCPHPLFNVHVRIHLQVFAFLIGRIVCTWEMLLVLHTS